MTGTMENKNDFVWVSSQSLCHSLDSTVNQIILYARLITLTFPINVSIYNAEIQQVKEQPRSLVSLLCLPWSLEERPWLRLVTLPSRIWVAKKPVGWEGWQSILFGRCDNLCGFQILSVLWQSLKTTRSIGVRNRVCRWRMLHDFCCLQNIEGFRSQRNSAAE